jgi:DNA gyrase subunit A
LFIATNHGKAIRFSEKLVPPQGGPGIRLENGDSVAAITSVYPDSGVFLADSLGRGTIRLMNSFSPNKGAGGGGKNAMNTDQLIAAVTVNANEDIFMISRLSKMIRFTAEEVPAKEGNVQGVNCMGLRGDEVISIAVSVNT